MTEEKRQKERKKVGTVSAVTNVHTNEKLGHLVNVTKDGFMLSSDEFIDANCVFQMSLELVRNELTIKIGAESLWSEKSLEVGVFWTGFRIIDISDDTQQKLDQFIDTLN